MNDKIIFKYLIFLNKFVLFNVRMSRNVCRHLLNVFLGEMSAVDVKPLFWSRIVNNRVLLLFIEPVADSFVGKKTYICRP